LDKAQLRKLMSVVVNVPSRDVLLDGLVAQRRGEYASLTFDEFVRKAEDAVQDARRTPNGRPRTPQANSSVHNVWSELLQSQKLTHRDEDFVNGLPRAYIAASMDCASDISDACSETNDADPHVAFLTRKMKKEERESPGGQRALQIEIDKLCKYKCFGPPLARRDARPDGTVCALGLLGFVKHAELRGNEKLKGRAVALGNRIWTIATRAISGSSAALPWADLKSSLGALEEGRLVDLWALVHGYALQSVDIENAYIQEPWPDGFKPHYLIIPKSLWCFLPTEFVPGAGCVEPHWPMA
jgi:hypothetical protein